MKEVKEKRLPEPTDEWVAENSEFETVAELRADIAERIRQVPAARGPDRVAGQQRRERWCELVDDEEIPEVLVDEELSGRVHDLGHRLEQQDLTLDQFLAATGRDAEALLAELRLDAFRAVKADLALRALADAENLEVDEAELAENIASSAERMELGVAELRDGSTAAGVWARYAQSRGRPRRLPGCSTTCSSSTRRAIRDSR